MDVVVMPSKYHNFKTECDGIKFDSVKECKYYCTLKLMKRCRLVKDFKLQVAFELQPRYTNADGRRIREISYIADFVVEYADGHTEVVDVKGMKTEVYKLKKKLFEYKYPNLTIKEV